MSTQDSCDSLHDLAEKFGFATYFNHLLKTKTGVDVTFILETDDGEVKLFAHQLILSMRSAYFADMFYGEHKKKEYKTICLEKVNPKAFEDMIRYCYGRKPYLEAVEEICILLKVAYEFKVMSLMNLCRTSVLNMKITPENVFSMLGLSEYIEDKKLRDTCCKFLEVKTKHVQQSYEMNKITPAMVHILLNLPRLSLSSEFELIKWLLDWAKAKVEEVDNVCRSAREYLQNLLKYINFLSLTFEEFAILCKDYPNFFSSEEIACIYINIAHPGIKQMPEWYCREMKIREYIREESVTETIDEEIGTFRKCVTNILARKEGQLQLLEDVSEIDKRLQKSRTELSECFVKNYRTFNLLKANTEVRKKLKEMIGKSEIFEICKEREENLIEEATEQLKRMKDVLEDNEFVTMKEMLENDEELERMRTLLEIGEELEKISEILENDEKEFERIKEMLENGEEVVQIMRELLENGEGIYKILKDFKSINESLEVLRAESMEEIIGLSIDQDHDTLQEHVRKLTELKQKIL